MAQLPSDKAFLPAPQAHKINCAFRTSDGVMLCDCSRSTVFLPELKTTNKRFDRGQPINALDAVKRETVTALNRWATELTQSMQESLSASLRTAQPKANAQHLINVLNLIEDITGVKVE